VLEPKLGMQIKRRRRRGKCQKGTKRGYVLGFSKVVDLFDDLLVMFIQQIANSLLSPFIICE
jgi:hypothetical protein